MQLILLMSCHHAQTDIGKSDKKSITRCCKNKFIHQIKIMCNTNKRSTVRVII